MASETSAVETSPETIAVSLREVFEDADRLSLDEVLMDVENWSQIDDVVLTDHEKFDFIPANTTFKGNKTPLDTASASEKRLGKALEQLVKITTILSATAHPDLRVHEECDHCEWGMS